MTNMTKEVGSVWCQGRKLSVPASNIKLFEGSLLFINSSGKGIYSPSAGNPFLGVVAETCDNSDSSEKEVFFYTTGVYKFTSNGLTSAALGKTVYAAYTADSNTVTILCPSSEGDLVAPVGKITKVISATECMVRIDGFAMKEDAYEA